MAVSPDLKRVSKTLSLLLRHRPEVAGLELDREGWVAVDALLQGLAGMGQTVNRALIERVVVENPKQRFEFDADGTSIRARQGHSVQVELALEPVVPPPELFHGTARRNLDRILVEGLTRQARHHVHLSAEEQVAHEVGRRHDPRAVILRVAAAAMHGDGHEFWVTENGVWLMAAVPPTYLSTPETAGDQ